MDVYQHYDAAYKPDVDPDGIMTRVVEASYADGNGAQADENGYYSVDDGRWAEDGTENAVDDGGGKYEPPVFRATGTAIDVGQIVEYSFYSLAETESRRGYIVHGIVHSYFFLYDKWIC